MQRETVNHFAPVDWIDPDDLSQAGWGVILAHDANPAVREAMKRLLDVRKGHAARVKDHYHRDSVADKAYRPLDPNETKRTFLARSGGASRRPGEGALSPPGCAPKVAPLSMYCVLNPTATRTTMKSAQSPTCSTQ